MTRRASCIWRLYPRAEFGPGVAKLVADVSLLGKLPQIMRRHQRSMNGVKDGKDGEPAAAAAAAAGADPAMSAAGAQAAAGLAVGAARIEEGTEDIWRMEV